MFKKDMSKNQSIPDPVCERCGKLLENMVCSGCNGEGYYRAFLFFKKECQSCRGSGHTLRCPDEFDHILKDFNVTGKANPKPIYQEFRKGTSYKVPPALFNKVTSKPQLPSKQIPPPWHPRYPNPWHPMHPRNPLNPNNPNSPWNPNSPFFPNHRLPGDSSTDAPPPDVSKKKKSKGK